MVLTDMNVNVYLYEYIQYYWHAKMYCPCLGGAPGESGEAEDELEDLQGFVFSKLR